MSPLVVVVLLLSGCSEPPPDEGVAVGNPGKAEFAIGAPDDVEVESAALHVGRVGFDPCAGDPIWVDVDEPLGLGDSVAVPEGTYCSATVEFAGLVELDGPELDVDLAAPTLTFDLGAGLAVAGNVVRFRLGRDGWLSRGLVDAGPVAPGDTRHDILLQRMLYGASVRDVADDGVLGAVEAPAGYVAVGDDGLIVRSADGETWDVVTDGGETLRAVVHAEGTWVAVGGDTAPRILVSHDGQRWVDRPAPPTDQILKDVAWGGEGFTAVGIHGIKMTSPDGWSWRDVTGEWITELHAVAWGDGRFVGVGHQDWAYGIATVSPDGAAWEPVVDAFGVELYDVVYGDDVWVAVGTEGVRGVSADGRTWDEEARAVEKLRAVQWSGERFVAAGTETAWTSVDGASWDPLDEPLWGVWDLAHSAQGWVAVGDEGAIIRSQDGVDWSWISDDGLTLRGVAAARVDGGR